MAERVSLSGLGPVAETLLLPLHFRAVETRRSDGVLRDSAAVALVERLDYDFARFRSLDFNQTLCALRVREFDRQVQAFLDRVPEGVVVEIGCGLDTRYERLDNGRALWWELDLPEVIAVRRKLLPEGPRRHCIDQSATEAAWIDRITAAGAPDPTRATNRPGPVHLFVAEGVLPYLPLPEVRVLVARLAERCPGAELIFDALAPWLAAYSRWHPALRALRKASAVARWGISRARDIENWAHGVRVLETWRYFDTPDPRLGWYRWLGWLPPMAGSSTVIHCRLGPPPGGNLAAAS